MQSENSSSNSTSTLRIVGHCENPIRLNSLAPQLGLRNWGYPHIDGSLAAGNAYGQSRSAADAGIAAGRDIFMADLAEGAQKFSDLKV